MNVKRIVLALCLGAGLSSPATLAQAHSPLLNTSPAAGAQVQEAPDTLVLTFGRGIRLTRVTISQDGGAAQPVDLGGQSGFILEYRLPLGLPLNPTSPGSYVVDWRGLGDDGHVQNGSFSFDVK